MFSSLCFVSFATQWMWRDADSESVHTKFTWTMLNGLQALSSVCVLVFGTDVSEVSNQRHEHCTNKKRHDGVRECRFANAPRRRQFWKS